MNLWAFGVLSKQTCPRSRKQTVPPEPEEVDFTEEEALAALLNEPDPPCQVARANF